MKNMTNAINLANKGNTIQKAVFSVLANVKMTKADKVVVAESIENIENILNITQKGYRTLLSATQTNDGIAAMNLVKQLVVETIKQYKQQSHSLRGIQIPTFKLDNITQYELEQLVERQKTAKELEMEEIFNLEETKRSIDTALDERLVEVVGFQIVQGAKKQGRRGTQVANIQIKFAPGVAMVQFRNDVETGTIFNTTTSLDASLLSIDFNKVSAKDVYEGFSVDYAGEGVFTFPVYLKEDGELNITTPSFEQQFFGGGSYWRTVLTTSTNFGESFSGVGTYALLSAMTTVAKIRLGVHFNMNMTAVKKEKESDCFTCVHRVGVANSMFEGAEAHVENIVKVGGRVPNHYCSVKREFIDLEEASELYFSEQIDDRHERTHFEPTQTRFNKDTCESFLPFGAAAYDKPRHMEYLSNGAHVEFRDAMHTGGEVVVPTIAFTLVDKNIPVPTEKIVFEQVKEELSINAQLYRESNLMYNISKVNDKDAPALIEAAIDIVMSRDFSQLKEVEGQLYIGNERVSAKSIANWENAKETLMNAPILNPGKKEEPKAQFVKLEENGVFAIEELVGEGVNNALFSPMTFVEGAGGSATKEQRLFNRHSMERKLDNLQQGDFVRFIQQSTLDEMLFSLLENGYVSINPESLEEETDAFVKEFGMERIDEVVKGLNDYFVQELSFRFDESNFKYSKIDMIALIQKEALNLAKGDKSILKDAVEVLIEDWNIHSDIKAFILSEVK